MNKNIVKYLSQHDQYKITGKFERLINKRWTGGFSLSKVNHKFIFHYNIRIFSYMCSEITKNEVWHLNYEIWPLLCNGSWTFRNNPPSFRLSVIMVNLKIEPRIFLKFLVKFKNLQRNILKCAGFLARWVFLLHLLQNWYKFFSTQYWAMSF